MAASVDVTPFAARLAAGEREACFGFTVTVAWPLPAAVAQAYAAFRSEAQALLGDCCHVYEAKHLHCTVATMCNFMSGALPGPYPDDERTRRVVDAWRAALDASFADIRREVPPFEVTLLEPELSAGAGFFFNRSARGGVAELRKRIDRASRDEALGATLRELGLSHAALGYKIPAIEHTTFLRWLAEPPGGLEAFRAATLPALRSLWRPVSGEIAHVPLVLETVPFMHMEPGEQNVVAAWRLGE